MVMFITTMVFTVLTMGQRSLLKTAQSLLMITAIVVLRHFINKLTKSTQNAVFDTEPFVFKDVLVGC